MTKPHQTPFIGTHLILIKDGKLLLQLNASPPFQGMYTFVAGHVDEGENVIEALVREAKEEANIILDPNKMTVKYIHQIPNAPYKGETKDIINFFIEATEFEGIPSVNEPEKCDEVGFFDLNALPDNLSGLTQDGLKAYLKGEIFNVYTPKHA